MRHPSQSATLANWQQAPFNRWSFLHVDRVVPTAVISRGGAPAVPFAVRERPVLEVPVTRISGHAGTVADVLCETDTDAFLVLNDGVIVHESYADTVERNSRHLLMSVTKSFVGVVAGILADRRILNLDGQITDHIGGVVGFGYEGASVRNLLDMRSGVAFSEEYLNPDAEVRILEHAASWRPYQTGLPTSTHDYLSRLPADGPHGGVFRDRSSETDILGWVCERAAGAHIRPARPLSSLRAVPVRRRRRARCRRRQGRVRGNEQFRHRHDSRADAVRRPGDPDGRRQTVDVADAPKRPSASTTPWPLSGRSLNT